MSHVREAKAMLRLFSEMPMLTRTPLGRRNSVLGRSPEGEMATIFLAPSWVTTLVAPADLDGWAAHRTIAPISPTTGKKIRFAGIRQFSRRIAADARPALASDEPISARYESQFWLISLIQSPLTRWSRRTIEAMPIHWIHEAPVLAAVVGLRGGPQTHWGSKGSL